MTEKLDYFGGGTASAEGAGTGRKIFNVVVITAAALIVGLLVWQGITAHGAPVDPDTDGISSTARVMNTAILVFREGLEAILVLAALTASMARTEKGYWKPIAAGAGLSLLATIATWFVVVAIIADASQSIPALDIQAATGLLAVVVLLIVMNWFFHKIYWTGWITFQNRKKRSLLETPGNNRKMILRGLALIGFTSVYREGFEVVVMLQSWRLKAGSIVIMEGAAIGLVLTGIVAMLTFVAHYRLPYKRMLVLTGMLLGVVLIVMVGESVQEMQQAHWMSDEQFATWPDWLNTWFAIFPTRASLIAQGASAAAVIGSYFVARRIKRPVAEQWTEAVGNA